MKKTEKRRKKIIRQIQVEYKYIQESLKCVF